MRRSKFKARKCVVDGITFDSKLEGSRYVALKERESQGLLQELHLQPKFTLQDTFTHEATGATVRRIEYVADFMYWDVTTGDWVIEDVKGMETPVFQLKRKLFLKRYPDYKLVIVN